MDLHQRYTVDHGSYTDLNRLNRLKFGEQRDSEANIRKVAQEFEALFISEMMKAMRSANDVLADDNLFNSSESKAYRDMYDQQMSVTLAQGRGIGMADVLVKQMMQMGKLSKRANPFPDGQLNKEAESSEKNQTVEETVPLRRTAALSPVFLPMQTGNGIKPASESVKTNQAQAARQYAAVSDQKLTEMPDMTGKEEFNDPNEFISTMLPIAQQAAARLGVDARYLVAQAALETGWGKKMLRDTAGNHTFNLFGIKAHRWKGQSVRALTSEYVAGEKVQAQADFRKYNSFAQSFNDYVDFLQSNGRYAQALRAADDPEQFVRELQRAGYATDPRYAEKISRIAQQMQNYQQMADAQIPRIAERG